MMWHPGVIHSELELVDKLSMTLTVNDSFTDAPELNLGEYSLKVPDNLETRQKMMQDFTKRFSVFLKQVNSVRKIFLNRYLGPGHLTGTYKIPLARIPTAKRGLPLKGRIFI